MSDLYRPAPRRPSSSSPLCPSHYYTSQAQRKEEEEEERKKENCPSFLFRFYFKKKDLAICIKPIYLQLHTYLFTYDLTVQESAMLPRLKLLIAVNIFDICRQNPTY